MQNKETVIAIVSTVDIIYRYCRLYN